MKIFFTGCSWTYGNELKKPLESRYSKHLCDYYKAEETNVAISGGSNHRVLRTTLVEYNMKNYDLAIIQLSSNARTEYYDDKLNKWKTNNIGLVNSKDKKSVQDYIKLEYSANHIDFWTYYFTEIYSETYGKSEESMIFTAIQNHFEVIQVPYLLISMNSTNHPYDLVLSKQKYPKAPKGHPNELGHYMISRDLISLIETKYPRLKL